jgi:hypothetical protein
MTNTTLNMTLLLRRAAFTDSCLLKEGEPGYHTGTHELKIGQKDTNGNLIQWKDLPIANKSQIDTLISNAIAAHAAGYYTKQQVDDLLSAVNSAIGKVRSDLTAEVTARESADTELQNQINTKLTATDFTGWKSTHENGHAKSATEITSEITTAVNGEKSARESADNAINQKIGNKNDASTVDSIYGTIAKVKEDAFKEAASKASAAQSAAISSAESTAESKDVARAQAAQAALDAAVSALETKITTGDSTTLGSAKTYADDKVAAEAELRIAADNALGGRLNTVEAKLNNVSNVMDFVGAKTALPAEGSNQSGDVVVITAGDNAGKEFVYDDSREAGKKWVEFGSTSATDSAIADLKSRMEAAETNISTNGSAITTLGTTKLDAADFNSFNNGTSKTVSAIEADIVSKANAAKSSAITEAGKLDAALHTVISKEIDDDVSAAISDEVTRSNDYADKAESDAIATAASQADAKDAALKTAIEGVASTAKSSDSTIAGAKKYADEKAEAAQTAAVNTASADATSKANAAKEAAISAAATDATTKANNAKSGAISAVVGTANDDADDDTIKGVRKAFAAGDTATLTSAQTYADTVAANAVKNNITAGNTDIVITRPTSGDNKDKTVISHKVYGTGTYTKPDSVSDANFVTGINIENGHVTGASIKSLAEALSAMTFIFDGGTSAN